MSDRYEGTREQLLRGNRLLEAVESFEASEDRVWYFDRPVFNPDEISLEDMNDPLREFGVRLGLDLLRDWSRSLSGITSVLASKPFLRIEESWLSPLDHAMPPSVNICLAKTPELLQPGSFDIAALKHTEFPYELDLSDMDIRYIEGFGGGYSWLMRVRQH